MKKILFVIYCYFAIQCYTFASIEVIKTYKHTHINISLHFNHDFIDKELWYYDAVSELLNNYIHAKIKNKKWKRKKIDLHLFVPTSKRERAVEIKAYKRKYSIYLKEYTHLTDLAKLIHYVHLQNGEILQQNLGLINDNISLKTFKQKIIKNANKVDMSFFRNKKISVFKLDELQIIYENEKMYYEFYHQKLKNLEADFPKPVKIGKCYILASDYHIYVYRHGLCINQAKIKKKEEATRFADYNLDVTNDNVKLYFLGRPILSYRLSKNEFCQIKYNPNATAKIFPSRL